jgi:hypothetical protein
MKKKNTVCTFIHVPKTGGVTLQDVISRKYSGKQMMHIDNVRMRFRSVAETQAAKNLPFMIKGHLDINEVIDIPNNYLFTLLREPIARVISHYSYLKALPTSGYYRFLNEADATIEKLYAMKTKKDMDNCFVRYFSGHHELECGHVSNEHYEKAMSNLKSKIHFFGLQEYFDESLIILAGELQWTLPVYRRKNVTENKVIVSPQTMEFLKEANRWDVLLYNEARQLFMEKVNNMSREDQKRLSRLRLLNKAAALYPF